MAKRIGVVSTTILRGNVIFRGGADLDFTQFEHDKLSLEPASHLVAVTIHHLNQR
jgi:hypothetical protein